MSGETTTATEDKIAGLEVELDRLSLEQTLRDFEVANARAVDLTQRLIGLSHEITSLREQLVAAQAGLANAQQENRDLRASMSFRLAQLVSRLRRLGS